MEYLLSCWDKIKKDNFGKHCHKQRKHVSPFVLSVDGMQGKEALVVLANLSQLMVAKMDKSVFHMRGWINGRVAILVTGSYFLMICRARLPSPLWDWEPN